MGRERGGGGERGRKSSMHSVPHYVLWLDVKATRLSIVNCKFYTCITSSL